MEIRSAIAKHIGTNLITHNRNVSVSSEYIGKNYLKVTNSEVLKMIRLGGLLHDIGKMTEEFQSLLQKKIKKTTHKFRHNEIGGAFIYTYFNSKDLPINYISNTIYWHHGISNKLNDSYYSDVFEKVTDQEIEWMKELVIILLDESFILLDPRTGNIKTPLFYTDNDEENENMSIIRTCIISADRIVSMLEEKNPDLLIDDSNVSLILDGIQTDHVQAEPEIRGHEIGVKFYEEISKAFKMPIYSGTHQTPNSRYGIWNKLLKKYPRRVVVYNTQEKTDTPIQNGNTEFAYETTDDLLHSNNPYLLKFLPQ